LVDERLEFVHLELRLLLPKLSKSLLALTLLFGQFRCVPAKFL